MPHNNIVKKKATTAPQTNKQVFLGEYYNYAESRKKIVTVSFLEAFAEGMIKDAINNKNCLCFGDLFLAKGIASKTFYDWLAKYPFLDKAYDYACAVISIRREKGSLTRKLDTTTVLASMHMYDDRWKAAEEWKASLKEKQNAAAGIKIVQVSDFRQLDEPEITPLTYSKICTEVVRKVECNDSKSSEPKTPEEVARKINRYTRWPKNA